MRKLLLLGGILLLFNGLQAQNIEEYNNKVTDAYLQQKMKVWQKTLASMEEYYRNEPSDSLLLHVTINYYGYLGYLVDSEQHDSADVLIQKTETYAEKLEKKGFCSDANAIKAGLIGYRIMLKPLKAPVLGRRNQRYIEKATSCDSVTPLAWSQKANAYYHMPGLFGGSYEKASRYFGRAVDLYESKVKEYPQWVYLNDLMWYGKSLQKDGQTSRARSVYNKALQVAPGFEKVNDELLPGLEE